MRLKKIKSFENIYIYIYIYIILNNESLECNSFINEKKKNKK